MSKTLCRPDFAPSAYSRRLSTSPYLSKTLCGAGLVEAAQESFVVMTGALVWLWSWREPIGPMTAK